MGGLGLWPVTVSYDDPRRERADRIPDADTRREHAHGVSVSIAVPVSVPVSIADAVS